jgi:RHS repeat-associated protein
LSSPDTGVSVYTYDAAGNLQTARTARDLTLTYTNDVLNRVTSAAPSDSSYQTNYVYDNCTNGLGRLCSISNSFSNVTYGYDSLGNVISHQSMAYTYTPSGRLRTMTYPSGAMVTYDYDIAGQVNQVRLTRNGTTEVIATGIQYAPFGAITALTYGNGKTLAQTWDIAYYLRSQATPGVMQLDYTQYDLNGNLQQRLDVIASQWSNFAYDALDRLDTASGAFGSRDYDYDSNGNRTRLTEGAAVTNYIYAPDSNRLTQAGGSSVVTDANGNITAQDTRSYIYTSAFDHLTQVLNNGSQIASYAYNGLGQRISKQADGVTTNFAYGLNGELLVETPSNTPAREYIYLNGQPLAVMDQTALFYVQNDHLGIPQVLTNSAGTVVWKATYDSFGEATVTVNVVKNNLRLPGQYFDSETGLHYNWHRYYDPKMGRYISSDPIGLDGGLNTYAYVQNNPLYWIDPNGLERKPGKTPPKLWPKPPSNVCGPKPRWNPDGYWEGKRGRRITWDDRSHGAGQDRGKGPQGGHWDDESSDNRWDQNGDLLPGSPDAKKQSFEYPGMEQSSYPYDSFFIPGFDPLLPGPRGMPVGPVFRPVFYIP